MGGRTAVAGRQLRPLAAFRGQVPEARFSRHHRGQAAADVGDREAPTRRVLLGPTLAPGPAPPLSILRRLLGSARGGDPSLPSSPSRSPAPGERGEERLPTPKHRQPPPPTDQRFRMSARLRPSPHGPSPWGARRGCLSAPRRVKACLGAGADKGGPGGCCLSHGRRRARHKRPERSWVELGVERATLGLPKAP